MEILTLENLLLRTAFWCMAADGFIDKREIDLIEKIVVESSFSFKHNVRDELNNLINEFNVNGKEFLYDYFEIISKSNLSEDDELKVIDIAIRTIKADELIDYTEIKFFKNIRYRLKVSDERIIFAFADLEMFLEPDLKSDSFLQILSKQYFDAIELPKFDLLKD